MKQVANDDDGVRARSDHALDGQAKGAGDIRLSLIDPGGGLTMVLPNAQVGVGEVSQSHPGNLMYQQDLSSAVAVVATLERRDAMPGPHDLTRDALA